MKTKPVSASEKLNFSARNGWSEGEYQYHEAEVAARQTRLRIVRAEVKIWDQGTREGFAWEDAKLDSFESFSRPNSRIKVHPDKNNKAWKLGSEIWSFSLELVNTPCKKNQHAHCSPLRTRKGEKIQPESKGRRQGEDQTSGPVRSMIPKPVVFARLKVSN